jgi:hypothetical protein
MTTETNDTEWWHDHKNLRSVALDMVEQGDEVDYVLDMLEKPWKWQDTWERVQAARAGEAAALRDQRELRELRAAGAHWGDTET